MPDNVGGVSVSVRLDDKDALNELNRLRKKIAETQKTLSKKTAEKNAIEDQMRIAGAEADAALIKVQRLKKALANASPSERAGVRAQLTDANAEARELTKIVNSLSDRYVKLGDEISTGEENLAAMKSQSANLEAQIRASTSAVAKLRAGVQRASAAMRKSFARLGRMITQVFWFATTLRALNALRDYLSDVLQSFPEIRDALAEIKGNLLTAFNPIFNALLPAFVKLLGVLNQVSAVLADIVAKLFGTTASAAAASAEALQQQSKAYADAGKSAKKAAKSMASFDQINKLDNGSSSSASASTAPTFGGTGAMDIQSMIGGIELLTGEALMIIGAVLTFTGVNIPMGITLMALGAAEIYAAVKGDDGALASLLEGKIGALFLIVSIASLVLGAILLFTGVNIPLGIALIVIGASMIATMAKLNPDAIENLLTGQLAAVFAVVSIAFLVLGAILAFTGVNLPLGIALMALGAVGIATVAALNWDTIEEALKGPIGKITAAVSIAFLVLGAILTFTGVAIPLGISLLVLGAMGIAAVVAVNWNSIVEALRGPIGEIVGIVSIAFLVLGIVLLLSGVAIPLGIALLAVGAAGLAATAAVNWDSIVQALRGPIGEIVGIVSGALLVLGIILTVCGIFPLGIALIVAGAAGLVTVAALNWDSIKEKIAEVWRGIKRWWKTNVAPIFTKDWWKEKFKSISDGLKEKIKDGINGAIALLNRFIDWVNDKLNISWDSISILGKEIIPSGSFQLFTLPHIPELARGAVIPPNREFMAVLGDQKSGTNIEAPLDTIVQAVRQAFAGGIPGGGNRTIILQVDRHELGRVTFDAYNAESQRVGMRLGGSRT